MDSTRTSRYTVLNSDSDNIYISKSLLNKLSQQQNQPNQQSGPTAESASEQGGTVPPSAARKQAQPDFSSDTFFSGSSGAAFGQFSQPSKASLSSVLSDNAHTMPASIDPEYIAKHAQFDSSTHLFALRGEYERKLQQYQQIWRARFDEIEGLNEQLFKLNSDKFAKEVARVDERFFKNHSTYEVPCKGSESVVFQCYSANPKRPLLCADQVKQFAACVDKTRVDTLKP